jgi:hypothetical protein
VRYSYLRLYADEQGESHFADVALELTAVDFAPPAAPVYLSPFLPARQVGFFGLLPDWEGGVLHPSPSRQVVVILSGRSQVTASDGMVRELAPGAVLLLEDTTGRGHSSRVLSAEPVLHVVVQLPIDPQGSSVHA